MSAYAALVSVLQILETILDSGGLRIICTRPQLQSLKDKVILLLDFLDIPSSRSQMSELETRIRTAAYKAEYLLELQMHSRILRFPRRKLINDTTTTLCYIFYAYEIVSTNTAAASYIDATAVLAVAAVSTATAAYVHLAVQVYDRSEELSGPEMREVELVRKVLEEFSLIAEDVSKMKEEAGDFDTSALISLRKLVESILDSGGKRRISRNRANLEELHEKVSFLLDFIRNEASACMITQKSEVKDLDVRIRRAANKAKALIQFLKPLNLRLDSSRRRFFSIVKIMLNASLPQLPFEACTITRFINYQLTFPSFPVWIEILLRFVLLLALAYVILVLSICGIAICAVIWSVIRKAPESRELPLVINDLTIIVRNAVEIKDACRIPTDLPSSSNNTSSSNIYSSSSNDRKQSLGGTGKDCVVGLHSDLIQIKARLLQHSSKRELVSVVGMGGIGKTTLARQVYNDTHIVTHSHFDVRAWVTVSQDYSLRQVLLCLLDSAQILTEEKREDSEDELSLYLHKHLMRRRYLIVMDDVWDIEIWDFTSRFFPENDNGSRILVTSRLPSVVSCLDSSSPLHHMQCLNQNDSWYLLHEKVFEEEICPSDLESIGKEIAMSCGGLPLAIVVIGGLLYKDKRTEIWREVAENLSSNLRQTEEQCLEILGLSYNHLPHNLRPCFLYMGFFPGDYEIHVSRLINLWVGEGFLKPCKSKNLEELAEDYLKDLIDRNLIFVCKKSCNGKIRTCSIHSLLRDVCVQNANKENFLHVVNRGGYITKESPYETPRRLSIPPDALLFISSQYYVRSFLCTASKLLYEFDPSHFFGLGYLRVLDLVVVHFSEFPKQIIKLVQLRYLALHFDGSFPQSISNLKSLETIVHHHCSFCKDLLFPRAIWSMPTLRHLYVKPGCYLSYPFGYQLLWNSSVLDHLQTFVGIRNFKWSKGIIERIPHLKKLGISYDVSSSVDWSKYQLESLVDLHQLETLKIIIKNHDLGFTISHGPPKLAFPQKLKKLTLSGCGISWASMTTIGALPDLEALKLRREACSGSSWETVEGEFPKLIFLLLEKIRFRRWETDESHFPRLQRLVIRSCGMLEEIPCAIGHISTLEMIELVDCHPSAVASAKQVQEEQESMGNEVLKFHIEQRMREVDEMNLGNLDARLVFPGRLQVLCDVIQSYRDEIMLAVHLIF